MRNRSQIEHGDVLRKTLFMGILLLLTLMFILPGTAVLGENAGTAVHMIASSMDDSNNDATDDSNNDATDDSNNDATDDSNNDATDDSNDDATDDSKDKSTTDSVEFTVGSTSYMGSGMASMMDVAPFTENGRTFVPVRYLAQSLGVAPSDIVWNSMTQEVTLRKGNTTLVMTLGSPNLRVNGAITMMDTAPMVRNERTFLPARYVAEAMGYTVTWNEMSQKVMIAPQSTPSTPPPTTSPTTPQTNSVEMRNFAFTPATLTIQKGETVTWTNRDTVEHTVTFDDEESDLLGNGKTYSRTFDDAGTYNYTCTPHPNMKGTIIVE